MIPISGEASLLTVRELVISLESRDTDVLERPPLKVISAIRILTKSSVLHNLGPNIYSMRLDYQFTNRITEIYRSFFKLNRRCVGRRKIYEHWLRPIQMMRVIGYT